MQKVAHMYTFERVWKLHTPMIPSPHKVIEASIKRHPPSKYFLCSLSVFACECACVNVLHETYLLNRFLSTQYLLSIDLCCLDLQNLFILITSALYPWKNISPSSPFPHPLATIVLFSASMGFTTVNTSNKWNHAIFILLGQTFHLAQCLQVYPWFPKW